MNSAILCGTFSVANTKLNTLLVAKRRNMIELILAALKSISQSFSRFTLRRATKQTTKAYAAEAEADSVAVKAPVAIPVTMSAGITRTTTLFCTILRICDHV